MHKSFGEAFDIGLESANVTAKSVLSKCVVRIVSSEGRFLGTGTIYSNRSYILSTAHTVFPDDPLKPAENLKIQTDDGTKYNATIVYANQPNVWPDLALLKVLDGSVHNYEYIKASLPDASSSITFCAGFRGETNDVQVTRGHVVAAPDLRSMAVDNITDSGTSGGIAAGRSLGLMGLVQGPGGDRMAVTKVIPVSEIENFLIFCQSLDQNVPRLTVMG